MSITPAQWRERGRRVGVLDRELFVIEGGDLDAPPLLLLHGFPTSSWDWAPVWSELGESHRTIAFDFLGFGWSDKPRPHRYSIHEQADLGEALVRTLGLDAFHVLAHDYGDTVAQELLARQNEGAGTGRWLSLCLLNGGLFPETHQARPIQRLLLSRVGRFVNRLSNKRTFERSFSAVFGAETRPTRQELDSLWEIIQHDDGEDILYLLIHYMTDRRRHRERWVDALRESVAPFGLINGSVDPVSGAHMVARFRELIAEPRFIEELPTIGHYPQLEAPESVLEAYRRFRAGL